MIADTPRTSVAGTPGEKPALPERTQRLEAVAAQRDATRAIAARATLAGHRVG